MLSRNQKTSGNDRERIEDAAGFAHVERESGPLGLRRVQNCGHHQSVISRALAAEKLNDLSDTSTDEPKMNPSFDEKKTELSKWFDLADIHRDKNMTDVYSSYRGRIARTHPQYVRHFDVPTQVSSRPRRVTLLTAAGVSALYAEGEALLNIKPYTQPMRLTDMARPYIVEPGRFTTEGLERKMRIFDRDQFIEIGLCAALRLRAHGK
jgi:hypothetical protein